MAAPEPDPRRRTVILATAASAVLALVLDLATKSWAWEHLRDQPRVAVIKNWFYLDFSFNTGSAFGFLRGTSFARPLFIAITLATVLYMAALVRKLPTGRLYGFLAIGCIIGGALGNLHDRLLRTIDIRGTSTHGVVDFIQIYYSQSHASWPNFNIADTALVIGVGLLIPFLMFHAQPAEPAAVPRPSSAETA
jgi:signal peptidase II